MSIESRSNQYGTLFGDWKIVMPLGGGSNGKTAVFKLRRRSASGLEEYSALKVVSLIEEHGLKKNLSAYQTGEYTKAARVRQKEAESEVALMQQLQGKTNIVDYKDYRFEQWEDESGFGVDMLIRMELLSDLRGQLRQGRRYQETEIIRIGLDICQALAICHGKGILHRDIKPENIFYNEDGDYKLGDFGISRVLSASSMASTGTGTLAYAAPEQSRGSYDTRVDIYSLGLVLYELANKNCLPFAKSSYVLSAEIEKRLVGVTLPALCGVSEELADVILKACAFRPEERYQTARDFRQALEQVLAGMEPRKQPRTQDAYVTVPADRCGVEGTDLYDTSPANMEPEDRYKTVAADQWTGQETTKDLQSSAGTEKTLARKPAVLVCAIAGITCAVLLVGYWLGNRGGGEKGEAPETESPEVIQMAEQTSPETNPIPETEETTLPVTQPPVQEGIVQVSAGGLHSLGLNADGTVLAVGNNEYGQCIVNTWTDIIQISAGDRYSLGLCADGTVVAAGRNHYGQCDVYGWTDIQAVSAGTFHSVGLKTNGAVVAAGNNADGQCNVYGWTDIIQVVAGENHTVGLKSDGTVVAVGNNENGQCDVASWRDIIAVSAGVEHTVGLRADGTVVCAGSNQQGQCDTGNWKDIVSLVAGEWYTVGLRENGTVVAVGNNEFGQCDVGFWTDIVAISTRYGHTLGITEHGTVVAAGGNKNQQCNVSGW